MDQPTFADLECRVQKRKTRREPFPERSDTAKCATGMLAKDTERLTPLSGAGNLLAAKGQPRARCPLQQVQHGLRSQPKAPTAPAGSELDEMRTSQ